MPDNGGSTFQRGFSSGFDTFDWVINEDLTDDTITTLSDVTISLPADGQLLKYNGTSAVWENWTPNYLTSYTETDPIVGAITAALNVASPAADISRVRAVIPEPPSLPLKTISWS